MRTAPRLIDTLALYLRNAEPALDHAHALAEAAQQLQVVRHTHHVYGDTQRLPDALVTRAANASAGWGDLRSTLGHPSLALEEALDLTEQWHAPDARPWLVRFVLEERDFSSDKRQSLAASGHAMPDGSYPIENTGDLRNAVRAIGRAGKTKMASVKRHIIKRARALKALALLPDEWRTATAADDSMLSRPIVLQELFLPGGGGGGETSIGGDDAPATEGDGVPDDVIAPGTGTVGGPSGKVRAVQRALSEQGHYRGKIDGMYGPATMTAVRSAQTLGGLRAHGHVDGSTLQMLDQNSSENMFTAVGAAKR